LPERISAGTVWGGHRTPEDDKYSSSLVVVDATTGRDVWHFQTVHHDLWDYDLGSQPSLVDFPTDKGYGHCRSSCCSRICEEQARGVHLVPLRHKAFPNLRNP
jgi:hypothetical protein